MRIRDWSSDVCSSDLLIAAESGDGVARAHGDGEPLGQLDEELVAALVAEGVVDRLEAIDVEEQQRRARAVVTTALYRRGYALHQEGPVGELGERVVEGLPLQSLGGLVDALLARPQRALGLALAGDVGAGEDDAVEVAGLGAHRLGGSEEHTSELQSLM